MNRRMDAMAPPAAPAYQPPPAPAQAPAPEVAPPAAPAYMAELEQLASLRDAGVLSPEEFEAKKRQILSL